MPTPSRRSRTKSSQRKSAAAVCKTTAVAAATLGAMLALPPAAHAQGRSASGTHSW